MQRRLVKEGLAAIWMDLKVWDGLKVVTRPEMDGLGSHGKSGCNGSNAGTHWQGIGGVLNFASSEAWPSRKTAMEQWELTGSVGAFLDWIALCASSSGSVEFGGGAQQCNGTMELFQLRWKLF